MLLEMDGALAREESLRPVTFWPPKCPANHEQDRFDRRNAPKLSPILRIAILSCILISSNKIMDHGPYIDLSRGEVVSEKANNYKFVVGSDDTANRDTVSAKTEVRN